MQEREMTMLITAAGAALAGAGAAVAYDSTHFIRREYTVYSEKIGKDSKAVLLSDLHNKSYGKGNEKLLAAIDRIRPDFIVAAGDMVTANGEKTRYEVPAMFFKDLAGRYPVYYGIGNHEHKMKICPESYGDMFREYKRELKKCGVRFLENGRVYLQERNIEICGLEIGRCFYKRLCRQNMKKEYINKLVGEAKKERFELLIAHNPDYFKTYAGWGADLTVSGHIHGGVVRLPFLGGMISPALRLFPQYDGGLFEEQGKKMILSRGLGMHTVPLRAFNPGELVVIRLLSMHTLT